MDILGYTEMIRQSEANGSQTEMLRRLHGALKEGRKWLEDKYLWPELLAITKKDFHALKAFTDNIVIGWPVRNDAKSESEFGKAFSKLAFFQFQMVQKGFFVRGAVSVGDAYVDDITVFGCALSEAYQGESSLARDPRIILTASAVDAAKQHISNHYSPRSAPHTREVLRDSDGQWFLNYLDCVLFEECEDGPHYEWLEEHKLVIEEKLKKHGGNPPIWSKYAWAAGYHNYFCDLHSRWFSDEHKVNIELFRAAPSLLFEAES